MTSAPNSPGLSPRSSAVSIVVAAATLLVMGLVLVRVVQLQVAPGSMLAERAGGWSIRSRTPPLRGDLLDRRGRVVATTVLAHRAVVDPVLSAEQPDLLVTHLAAVLGEEPGPIGARLMRALSENDRRLADARRELDEPAPLPRAGLLGRVVAALGLHEPPAESAPERPRLIRYLPVGPVLSDDAAQAVRSLGLPGVFLEPVPIRVMTGGLDLAAIVGKVGFERTGLTGVERTLDEALSVGGASATVVRDARGRPLWLEDVEQPDTAAVSVTLTLDAHIQSIAIEELWAGVDRAEAAGGRAIVVDPATGGVLAMADVLRDVPDALPFPWHDPASAYAGEFGRPRYRVLPPDESRAAEPALARNRCTEDSYEPGSIFKPFVWATGLELGLMPSDELVTDTGRGGWVTPYGRSLRDVSRRDSMTWDEVLVHSSNVGMAKLAEKMTKRQLRGAVTRFGFGSPTGLGLAGEAAGIVTPAARWGNYTQTSVAMGHEVAVTPAQVARAFCVFARTGELAGTLPPLRVVTPPEGTTQILERVIPEAAAARTRRVLVEVAERMDAKRARLEPAWEGPSYTMFGKSGTAEIPLTPPPGVRPGGRLPGYYDEQYISSFVAAAPAGEPKLVVLVTIEDPGPDRVRRREHYGSDVAGPVVRRIVERALPYLGVEPDIQRPSPESAGSDGGGDSGVSPTE